MTAMLFSVQLLVWLSVWTLYIGEGASRRYQSTKMSISRGGLFFPPSSVMGTRLIWCRQLQGQRSQEHCIVF